MDFKAIDHIEKPWGEEWILFDSPFIRVKLLRVAYGERTSLQRHFNRAEYLYRLSWPQNSCFTKHILPGEMHRLCGGDEFDGVVFDAYYIEVQIATQKRGGLPGLYPLSDDDIERLEDDYGRA